MSTHSSKYRPKQSSSRPQRSSVQPSHPYRASSTRHIHEGLDATYLTTISKPTLKNDEPDVKITNAQYMGSYNWLDAMVPTIMVPGSPPIWTNKMTPYSVPFDSGTVYVDQNGQKMNSQGLLPLFEAVDVVKREEQIVWSTLDCVTDRNGLRKLVRWIKSEGQACKDFRIDVQLAGDRTVVFSRWEANTTEIMGLTYRVYGHNFEKKNTTPFSGCEGSLGHHRIIRYNMAGLDMLVRFEVDACLSTLPAVADIDQLVSSLGGLELSKTSPDFSTAGDLTVIEPVGWEAPQQSIVELATCRQSRESTYDWSERYLQLYLSQTEHFYFGLHEAGNFFAVRKMNISSPDMRRHALGVADSLKRLAKALKKIQKLVIDHGSTGRLSLVCEGGELRVYSRKSTESCLPDEVMARFDSGNRFGEEEMF